MHAPRTLGALVLACGAAAGASQANVTEFQDGTFARDDWTIRTFTDARTPAFVGTDLFPLGPGGPGDQSIRARHANPKDAWTLGVHLKTEAIFDPGTQGAIDGFSFSIDSMNLLTLGGNKNENLGQAVGLALMQGEDLFLQTPISQTTSSDWRTIFAPDVGLDDLAKVQPEDGAPGMTSPGSGPDLSAGGDPITLGFYTAAEAHPMGRFEYALYDNWRVGVNSVVPAPASALAIVLGVGVAIGRRR